MPFQKENKINLGRIHSDKVRKNMSIAHIGIKRSQESIQKMVSKNTGLKRSKDFCIKNGLIRKGKPRLDERGKKHWNWQGGINDINDTIRKSLEYKIWIRSILERDNFTCQKTGQVGGSLVVHHILNFSSNPELRFDIKNGITLSKKSHIEFHKIYKKRNNTREQLEEFLKK